MLEQVIEHHAADGVALQGDDDAHADAVGGLVLDLGDARNLAAGNLLRNRGDEVIRVDLVRQLGDDDGLAGAGLFDGGHAAHANGAAAGGVGIVNALVADDLPGRREIGALHPLHNGLERVFLARVRVVQKPVDGLGELTQVVRRDVGSHAHRDAAGAVHQQVRHARGQHGRLGGLAVVVGHEVHGVLADVADHLHGQRGHLRLRVTHGGRAVVAG